VAAGAWLGDQRRNASLVGILAALLAHRGLSWSAALGSRLRQAAGDLVRLTCGLADLLRGAFEYTAELAAACEWVIISFDKSCFNYTGLRGLRRQLGNLGQTKGQARGLWALSGLVLTPQGEPLGLIHLKVWARPDNLAPADQRPYHERESYGWEEGVRAASERLRPGQRVLAVADREADVFEFLNMARPAGVDLLVRVAQPRRYHEEGSLDPALASVLQGVWQRPRAQFERRRCGDREALLSLHYLRCELCAPSKWPAARRCRVPVTVVGVREEHPPPGVKPLCWVLVTTRLLHTAEAAWEMVQVYGRRWRIETLHETIKTEGLGIERLQLRSVSALTLAVGLYYVVGCRAMELCFQAREHPDQPALGRLDEDELAVLAVLSGRPVVTLGEAVAQVAKLGGWEGYPSSQPYGPRTVQRGLEALSHMVCYHRAERAERCDP
jgi:hypothetical protein